MNGLFVFDATYQNLPLEQDGFFNRENIPVHDTKADNYTTFMSVINAFSKEAQAQYPDMHYGGHYLLNNGVSIEPLPYEVLHVFNQHIVETAIHHGLCVYDSLSDTLYTPDHKKSYKKGTAHTLWQNQLATEAEKLALMEAGDTDEVPENARDAKKLINGMVKERLKQAGIKGVKKTASSSFGIDFGLHQLNFYIEFDCTKDTFIATVSLYTNIFKFLSNHHELDIPKTRLMFKDIYDIPTNQLSMGIAQGDYKISSLNQLSYEAHRAIDMFIDAYKHCQDLVGMYNYHINAHGDPKLEAKQIDIRFSNPFSMEAILVLAKLTKQSDYDDIQHIYLQKQLKHSVKQYDFDKKLHDERELKLEGESDNYKPSPYSTVITGDPEEFFYNHFKKKADRINDLNADLLLEMDLPMGLRF